MRVLVILRGPSNSGRTRFVREQGLEPWHVDQRQLQRALSDLTLSARGHFGPDRYSRKRMGQKIEEILFDKIHRGAFCVFEPIDTGAPRQGHGRSSSDALVERLVREARAWRYRVIIVDFATDATPERLAHHYAADHTPDDLRLPLEAACQSRAHMLESNALRDLEGVEWVRPGHYDQHSLLDAIEPEKVDLSRYDNVVFIGDIHGCYETLKRLVGDHRDRDDTAFVFLGDYINKGPSSARVLTYLARHFQGRENAWLIAGNHEQALEEWVNDLPITKKAFLTTTEPDLKRRRYRKRDARAFLEGLRDGGWFHWRGIDILATHGGFAQPPSRLGVLSSEHLQHGPENSAFDIDGAWENGVLAGRIEDPKRLFQVHGHRNQHQLPVAAGFGSFNLEAGVDVGGPLRALVLHAMRDGATRAAAIEMPNADGKARQARGARQDIARSESLEEVL